MKAILILDEIPNECLRCNLCVNNFCQAMWEEIDSKNIIQGERPSWCPLKPMPQPKNNSDEWLGDVWIEGYEAGWNKLLREIGGKEE